MSCSHEHHGHSHNHSHGDGHGHSHDDDDHLQVDGAQDHLYSVVDRDAIVALNEHEPVSARRS